MSVQVARGDVGRNARRVARRAEDVQMAAVSADMRLQEVLERLCCAIKATREFREAIEQLDKAKGKLTGEEVGA